MLFVDNDFNNDSPDTRARGIPDGVCLHVRYHSTVLPTVLGGHGTEAQLLIVAGEAGPGDNDVFNS